MSNSHNQQDLSDKIAFIKELEKLKTVYRQNVVVDGTRQENSAEHSWHIVLMALILNDHIDSNPIDLFKVAKMLLIHDVVEVDHGDVFLYDMSANQDKAKNEKAAASRIFGLLPKSLEQEFRGLWDEFEERVSDEAKFAAAMDSMQPILNHFWSNGVGIKKHGLKVSQIIEKKKHIAECSKVLWHLTLEYIYKGVEKGLYENDVGDFRSKPYLGFAE